MRILLTGGAGCLGSNLAEHWVPQGHSLLVLDNFATGKRDSIPPLPGVEIQEGTVADEGFVQKCFAAFKPEVVIHGAAAYKDPDDWSEDIRSNVLGSAHVARAAEANGVGRLINLQTALCYGRPQQLPIPADHPVAPFTSYGVTKVAGEQYVLLSEVPALSLRIANVTGPRLAIGPIPTFYKRLKAGQNCFCSDSARDFLDMSDFLRFMDLAIQPGAPTGIFNVSTGAAHSIKEIFDLVCDYLGLGRKDVPIQPVGADDVPVVALDPAATAAAFQWQARVSFEDTIRKQLAWYDDYGVTDVYSHMKPVRA